MKICPRCRQSYEDWVEVCADCGPSQRLVDPAKAAAVPPPKDDRMPLPGGGEEPVDEIQGPTRAILSFGEGELEEVLAMLDEAGIPAAIRTVTVAVGRRGSAHRHAVHVPAEKFEESVRRIRELFGLGEAAEHHEEACPACGHAVTARDVNCPECELLLVPEQMPKSHPFRQFLAEIGWPDE